MAQHDYNIANQTFPNTRTDINNALSAVASNNSGTAAPSTTFANQWFYETDTNLLQIRNEDNDAYITIAELDQSNDTVEYFKSDSIRTALIEFTDGDDAITIADGGAITINTSVEGGVVFNETSADVDLRCESNNNANMLFVDGGNDVVVVGSSVSETRVGQPLAITASGGTDRGGMAINSFLASSNGPLFDFSKSRNNTAGSHTVVQSGDALGTIIARGDDGDEFVDAAFISFDVDGTPGNNDMPGRITFGTTADGASGGTERMRIDSSGNVGIGNTSMSSFTMAGSTRLVVGDGGGDEGMTIFSGSSSFSNIAFADGTSGNARGEGIISYNHSNNAMRFFVSATERMRISSDGKPSFGFAGSSGSIFAFFRSSGNEAIAHLDATNASYAEDVLEIDCNRSATSSYNLIRATSGGVADSEMILDGAGRLAVDGDLVSGGADYAEFFEWKDGNSSSEDRVGYSVVLDGNKIVKATDSDDASKIIGVISGKPAVVGDSAWNKWHEKHLKDDFGRYIKEDYTQTEWTDDDGNIVTYQTDLIPEDINVPDDATVISKDEDGNNLQRRKVNPDWNKDTVYIARSERKEWDTVGLVGKLKLKKGQPTGTNWLKMRDISDTVEEWLVR